jgi:hypothetical protein
MTWKELLDAVDAAILPESDDVLAEIMDHVEEYHARPLREIGTGEMVKDVHGFVQWLQGLQDGWAALPEVIPHCVLLAWRNGYTYHPAKDSPMPFWRCEDCHMVLPNSTVSGTDPVYYWDEPCPVCGSVRLARMDLSRPSGTFLPVE